METIIFLVQILYLWPRKTKRSIYRDHILYKTISIGTASSKKQKLEDRILKSFYLRDIILIFSKIKSIETTNLKMGLEMIKGEAFYSHCSHKCLWRCFCNVNQNKCRTISSLVQPPFLNLHIYEPKEMSSEFYTEY